MTAFHHNKTARKTGEFIGINMNDITLLQILLLQLSQYFRYKKLQKSQKYFLSLFKIFEKRDKEVQKGT